MIEFPLAIHEQYVPYYFYQTLHRCEVFAGYSSHDDTGIMMNLSENRSKMRFRRMVDLEQPNRVRRRRADYVIVHHNIRQECEGLRKIKTSPDVALVLDELQKTLGPPVYTDRYLTAFKPRP